MITGKGAQFADPTHGHVAVCLIVLIATENFSVEIPGQFSVEINTAGVIGRVHKKSIGSYAYFKRYEQHFELLSVSVTRSR